MSADYSFQTAEDLDDDSDSSAFQYFDDDFLPVVFAEDPPKSLLCPLCGNVFKVGGWLSYYVRRCCFRHCYEWMLEFGAMT